MSNWLLDEELRAILNDMRAGDANAPERLAAYSRARIVDPAYERANSEWTSDIRPRYLRAVAEAKAAIGEMADSVPQSSAELSDAIDAVTAADQAIQAVEISPSNTIDQALGSDWWSTIGGKGAYADAVSESISSQMRVDTLFGKSIDDIQRSLQSQEKLRDALLSAQKDMEAQFADQRAQLTSLTGISGVVPVDIRTFIGLFPMILGLVIGVMILRLAEARRDAASSAHELIRIDAEDKDALRWLIKRTIAGSILGSATTEMAIIGFVSVGWIAFVAWQVQSSELKVLLSPIASATIGTIFLFISIVRDEFASNRLKRMLLIDKSGR